MSPWITVWCSVFLGLLGHTEGQATITLNAPHTHVVLAGHNLHLKFTVTVPKNTSEATLACYHGERKVSTTNYIGPNTIHGQKHKAILFKNSSESGEYHCRLTHADHVQDIYLAVSVQDEGFREMYHGLRDEVVGPVAAVTVFFLIFSVVGSIYICRSQVTERSQGDSGAGTAGARTSVASATRTSVASGNAVVQAVDDEDGGANSVYTTLESRPASIYDVLDPSLSGSRAQSKKSSRKRSKKQGEAASAAEDGIFESVYENV